MVEHTASQVTPIGTPSQKVVETSPALQMEVDTLPLSQDADKQPPSCLQVMGLSTFDVYDDVGWIAECSTLV